MKNKTNGFTLIELLIVVAIIGILAAVLIPNLLAARTTAQNRAAEAYGQNVYKAAFAYVADSVGNKITDAAVVGWANCATGFTAGSYKVPNPGQTVKTCLGTGVTGNDLKVTGTSVNDTPFSVGN